MRIAIIENQKTQYDNLRDLFKRLYGNKYAIIPENYKDFIEDVKIYLNQLYYDYRSIAFPRILAGIEDAEILLIDHRLCGNTQNGYDGIYLAQEIIMNYKNNNNIENAPGIIFFSRSPRGSQEIKMKLDDFSKVMDNNEYKENIRWIWVEKGYTDSPDSSLKESYFDEWIIKKGINKLRINSLKELLEGEISTINSMDDDDMSSLRPILDKLSDNVKQNYYSLAKMHEILELLKDSPIHKADITKKDVRTLIETLKPLM